MIIKKFIDLIEHKTLRTTPNVRLTLDIGEVPPEVVGECHELRVAPYQGLTLILGTNEEMESVIYLLDLLRENPKLISTLTKSTTSEEE